MPMSERRQHQADAAAGTRLVALADVGFGVDFMQAPEQEGRASALPQQHDLNASRRTPTFRPHRNIADLHGFVVSPAQQVSIEAHCVPLLANANIAEGTRPDSGG